MNKKKKLTNNIYHLTNDILPGDEQSWVFQGQRETEERIAQSRTQHWFVKNVDIYDDDKRWWSVKKSE